MYETNGLSMAELLIAMNQMQAATYPMQVATYPAPAAAYPVPETTYPMPETTNYIAPNETMPFKEVLRIYNVDPLTGVGSCIDQEKRKIKTIGRLKIYKICHCYIDKDGQRKEFLYVSYSSMDDSTHLAVVPCDKLASKNLLPLFESFQWMCKSKAMANDYIAYCIRCFPPKSTQYFPEYAGFSFIEQSENSTSIRFDCNRKCFDMKLLKHCSPYFTKKVLPSTKDRPLGIKGICEKYLDTDKKMMLFVFSLCGLLSSFFREEKYSMERILTISAPDAASERFATLLMQIFNRGTKPLTLCSNKSAVKTELLHAKDETVILSDRSIIDDDKKRAGAVLNTVYFCVINCILDFDSQPIAPLIYSILYDSQTVSGTSEDAVSEQFIAALNDAIRSGKLKILRHSKEIDFQEGTNQLIVKEDLLILEESAIENVLIPSMRTADNTCRILKCLKACEYLHATKKNRYPLVVYSNHRSLRPALIALKSDRILDSDVELMIEESRYAEWYSTAPAPEHFIPLTENRIGGVPYQVFDEKRKDNMHFFALGKSGSGKTHCLTKRMVSLQKLHRPVIVFDTSESFTEEEILEKLSVGCGETAEQDVRAYIAKHITFHRIEEDGIPVDLLKLGDSGNGEDTIRKIESIVESHNPNMGSKQQAAVHAAISDMIQKGNVDMASLYEVLTSEQIPYDLADQLADTLSFFVNFKANDRDWGELIEESKDIIIKKH